MLRSKKNSPFFFMDGYIYPLMKKKGEFLELNHCKPYCYTPTTNKILSTIKFSDIF